MEVEQLHLVLLAFAFPRLGDGAPRDGMGIGRDARGMIVRSRESTRRLSFGNGWLAAHPAREHLDVRWQMNMASFCLRTWSTKASFVPSRSPMHHNTPRWGTWASREQPIARREAYASDASFATFISRSWTFIIRSTVDQRAIYVSYEWYRPIRSFNWKGER